MTEFGADYFERGEELGLSCYTDYRWLPHLTIPMAEAMVKHLGITNDQNLLDFGCAKGYLVKAFRQLGYKAWGTDISPYAVEEADEAVWAFITLADYFSPMHPYYRDENDWDWVIAKDVMEHVEEAKLHEVLKALWRVTRRIFIVVPLGDGERYVIPDMEKDVTHRIRRPLVWWHSQLVAAGFDCVTSCHSMPGIKDKWVAQCPKGNGFLIGEKR